MASSPIKFSIQIPGAADINSWTDKVRRAEEHGFYSVSVPDHLSPELPQLAPMVALASAAMVTSRIRLAVTVVNNDFRHPVLLAKEAATLDLLSSGRLDLGLGAGWLPGDYTSTGVRSWDPPGERVARLEESVALLRELLTGSEVTFKGEHYEVVGFKSLPRPAQTAIPIMIGGGGKRILSLAARSADIISIIVNNAKFDSSMRAFEERLRWIAEAGGSERSDLVLGLRVTAGALSPPGTSRQAGADDLAAQRGVPASTVVDSPFSLVGDISQVKDRVVELAERYGISYFTLSEDFGWDVSRLVEELSER